MLPNQALDNLASVKSAFTSYKVANAGIFQINETLNNGTSLPPLKTLNIY